MSLPRTVRSLLAPLVASFTDNNIEGSDDSASAMYRRTYFLTQFKIVKKESLLYFPLTDIRVPAYSWPLLNLPSEKLEDLHDIVDTFKNYPISYLKHYYSVVLWRPLLATLYRPDFVLRREYSLSTIEVDYRPLRADYVVLVKDFAPPTVFVELARDHLVDGNVSHKDEDKIAFMMGASLFRLLWLNRDRGQEFLKKLRVYGILGGGTDFDLCLMYAVFPSVDDDRDFYFVFDSSKTHLRFKMLEYKDYSTEQTFTLEDDFVPCYGTAYSYPPLASAATGGAISAETDLLINSQTFEEFERVEQVIALSPDSNERYGENILKEGHINNHALKVLEKLSLLVRKQADLLVDMRIDTNPADPDFKYDENGIDFRIESQSTHPGPSPPKRRFRQTKIDVDSTQIQTKPTSHDISYFLDIFHDDFKGKDDAVLSDIKTICIKKAISRYEIAIYQLIKDSACFPECFGHIELPGDGNEIELKLEQLISGYNPDDYYKYTRFESFGAKIFVDLAGALITLHSVGYVHGDISPGNIGYNESKGIWQLFDFDNSRPIEEAAAAEGVDKYNVTKAFASPQYLDTGCYFPFDDFVGLVKTLRYIFVYISFTTKKDLKEIMALFDAREILDASQLQGIYFNTVKILWNQVQDPSDPSIKNAATILKTWL